MRRDDGRRPGCSQGSPGDVASEIVRQPARLVVHHGPPVVWVAQPDRRDDRPLVHDKPLPMMDLADVTIRLYRCDCRSAETNEARGSTRRRARY